MSAAGRGKRRLDDQYYTPAWVVDRLWDAYPLVGVKHVLEPAAGDGAIIRAIQAAERRTYGKRTLKWTAIELHEECRSRLSSLPDTTPYITDFLSVAGPREEAELWDVVITNPPYSLAKEFLEACLPFSKTVIFLLRTNFLESEKRSALLRAYPPDVYVLPNRPSFTGDGGTDATSYSWFVWEPRVPRTHGRLQVLASTPLEERNGDLLTGQAQDDVERAYQEQLDEERLTPRTPPE